MNELENKKSILTAINQHIIQGTKLTAFTLSLVIPLASFAQDSGCDTDSDCMTVIGDPDPWEPMPIPPDEGNSGGNDSGGNSSGGGGSNGPNPHTAECLALLNNKPSTCFSEPPAPQDYPWGDALSWNFMTQMALEGGAILGYDQNDYNNLLDNIALRYYQTESIPQVITAYWSEVAPHCSSNFPLRDSDGDIWPYSDSTDCVLEAYEGVRVFTPTFNTPHTLQLLNTFGLDQLTGGLTGGSFGAMVYNHVAKVQSCKAYYVARRAANCIE